MNRVKLKWIKKETFKRSTLITIPNLEELLSMNENFSADEVFFSIVKLALQEYEKYFPLPFMQKVYIVPNAHGEFDFIDNFEGYLEGKVPEDSINLIPASVLGFTTNYYTNFSTMIRLFRYPYPPHLTDFPYAAGVYYVRTLCNRPIVEDYTEESNCEKFSDKAAIYFMEPVGSLWKILFDEIYLQLCRYIINLRKNIDIPNMPITLFAGLEEDYNKLESSQQTIYTQSLGDGSWYM